MARHFDISSAPEPVQVGVMTAMQGSATFNVANATGEPIRARARVCAEVPAESQWFQITDEAERLFNVNESQEFSVQITVPEDIQGDVFAFRLQVFSVEEPEEVYTDGERKTLNIIRIVTLPFKLGSWWLIPAELAIALCVLWWHEVVSGMLAAFLVVVLLAVGGWLFYLYYQREKERAVIMATATEVAPEPLSPLQARMWILRWIPAILGIVLCLAKLFIGTAWPWSIVGPFAALLVIASSILYYLDYRRQRQQPPEMLNMQPIPPATEPVTAAPDESSTSPPTPRPWWRSGFREGATGLAALPWWWVPAILAVVLCVVKVVKLEIEAAWLDWWYVAPLAVVLAAASAFLGYRRRKKRLALAI
jgi:hypothetical protein